MTDILAKIKSGSVVLNHVDRAKPLQRQATARDTIAAMLRAQMAALNSKVGYDDDDDDDATTNNGEW